MPNYNPVLCRFPAAFSKNGKLPLVVYFLPLYSSGSMMLEYDLDTSIETFSASENIIYNK